jgi:hypothetical protein
MITKNNRCMSAVPGANRGETPLLQVNEPAIGSLCCPLYCRDLVFLFRFFNNNGVLIPQIGIELVVEFLALLRRPVLHHPLTPHGKHRRRRLIDAVYIHQVGAVAGQHRPVPLPG